MYSKIDTYNHDNAGVFSNSLKPVKAYSWKKNVSYVLSPFLQNISSSISVF